MVGPTDPPTGDGPTFVSRGGLKLHHALHAFGLDVRGLVCADLGCSTGGFTDCLLQAGAARVHAVDTAYGQLAWKLRQDARVVVHERTNALHAPAAEAVDLVVIDLGWTKQDRAIPTALRWLSPGGRILTLVKPHYESGNSRLEEEQARAIAERVRDDLPALGVRVLAWTRSPVLGGATSGKNKSKGSGNPEWLALLERGENSGNPAESAASV
jgi:23S rRNA (cytidine1920-2'-O)/16S rRNA (cytidine1409-2'-O)-methyltransferase